MRDSAFKQILIGTVVTVLGGLIVWWLTVGPSPPSVAPPKPSAATSGSVTSASQPVPQTQAAPIWLGFANEIGTKDREGELRTSCGGFSRVTVALNLGNRFSELCSSVHKTCQKVCDWEGRTFPCSAVSLSGRRDPTRIALCR